MSPQTKRRETPRRSGTMGSEKRQRSATDVGDGSPAPGKRSARLRASATFLPNDHQTSTGAFRESPSPMDNATEISPPRRPGPPAATGESSSPASATRSRTSHTRASDSSTRHLPLGQPTSTSKTPRSSKRSKTGPTVASTSRNDNQATSGRSTESRSPVNDSGHRSSSRDANPPHSVAKATPSRSSRPGRAQTQPPFTPAQSAHPSRQTSEPPRTRWNPNRTLSLNPKARFQDAVRIIVRHNKVSAPFASFRDAS